MHTVKIIFEFAATNECPMKTLNRGGGWLGGSDTSVFEKIATLLNPIIKQLFPANVTNVSEMVHSSAQKVRFILCSLTQFIQNMIAQLEIHKEKSSQIPIQNLNQNTLNHSSQKS